MTVPLMAERARERLDRGLQALARAGDDPAILAYALSGLHGALDAHLRTVVASDSRVPAEIRDAALDAEKLSFRDVANAGHGHLELPESERNCLLEALFYREAQTQGDGFAWDRAGLEEYARYVARKLGEPIPESRRPGTAAVETPTRPAPRSAVAPAGSGTWTDRWDGLAATRPYRAASLLARGTTGLRASHVVFILSALLAVSLLWRWVESAASDAASRAAPPVSSPGPVAAGSPVGSRPGGSSVAAASPAVAQSPAPASGQAAATAKPTAQGRAQGEWLVVGNTDGEGVYLRRTPSMDDRLEPYEDGTWMRVIGPDREAEGRRWKHVSAEDGLVGFVPAQYLVPPR